MLKGCWRGPRRRAFECLRPKRPAQFPSNRVDGPALVFLECLSCLGAFFLSKSFLCLFELPLQILYSCALFSALAPQQSNHFVLWIFTVRRKLLVLCCHKAGWASSCPLGGQGDQDNQSTFVFDEHSACSRRAPVVAPRLLMPCEVFAAILLADFALKNVKSFFEFFGVHHDAWRYFSRHF